MSLARTALRLAVLEALAPFDQQASATPLWPTYAGRQVFDSQISPVALEHVDTSLPVIVVSCDAAKTDSWGSAPDASVVGDGKEVCALAFEIMVPVKIREGDGEAVALVGPTDAMAKALLEMIEDQIQQRLADARMNGPLHFVLQAIEEIDSQPYSDADTDIALSATRLELKCQIAQRQRWPAPGASGLARLPEPLRSVAMGLPPESYGGLIAAGLADLIGNPASFPALNELRLAANLVRAEGDAAPVPADAAPTPPVGDIGGSITPPQS
jgi:hypothetical protein